MNIPFYRFVRYLDDGHNIFQCLQCGEKVDVESDYQPRFCSECGVEYKGFILPKKNEYVPVASKTTELYFQVESAYDWGDGEELNWKLSWRGSNSSQEAIKHLKYERAERERDQKYHNNGWKFRITTKKQDKSNGYVIIDVDEYYRRTGKKFDRKLYDKVG